MGGDQRSPPNLWEKGGGGGKGRFVGGGSGGDGRSLLGNAKGTSVLAANVVQQEVPPLGGGNGAESCRVDGPGRTSFGGLAEGAAPGGALGQIDRGSDLSIAAEANGGLLAEGLTRLGGEPEDQPTSLMEVEAAPEVVNPAHDGMSESLRQIPSKDGRTPEQASNGGMREREDDGTCTMQVDLIGCSAINDGRTREKDGRMSSGKGMGNVVTSVATFLKDTRRHDDCRKVNAGAADINAVVEEINEKGVNAINAVRGNLSLTKNNISAAMDCESSQEINPAGHSTCLEAAAQRLEAQDMKNTKHCTQGVCDIASASHYSAEQNNLPGNITTNAWNKAKFVAFENVDEAMALAKEQGPVIPDQVAMRDNFDKLDRAVVGKLMGKNVPFTYLNSELQKRWAHFGNFKTVTVSNDCFICLFESHSAREAVLLGGPWSVGGQIIGLDRWTPNFSPDSLEGLSSPVWIRLPQLPLLFWDNRNIGRIVAHIGQPLGMDLQTSSWGRCSYARVCVRIDLSKRLPTGVWIQGIEGKFFQPVEYEGISLLCFKCGRVGHRAESCSPINKQLVHPPRATPQNKGKEIQVKQATVATPQNPLRQDISEKENIPTGDASTSTNSNPLMEEDDKADGSNSGKTAKDDYGPWILVAPRRSKNKMPTRRKADRLSILTTQSPTPKPPEHSPVLSVADAAQFLTTQHLLEKLPPEKPIPPTTPRIFLNSEPLIFSASLKASAPVGKSGNSGADKLKKGKNRALKSQGVKDFKTLGPIELSSRKRRKNSIDLSNGGDASPSVP